MSSSKIEFTVPPHVPTRAWVRGGFVRDWLLGRQAVDMDWLSTEKPSAKWNRVNRTGIKRILVERYIHYKPYDELTYVGSLKVIPDICDFTINALYASPDGQITDSTGFGFEDLAAKRLRLTNGLETILASPRRLLRAVYFKHKLGFKYDAELADLLREHMPRLGTELELTKYQRRVDFGKLKTAGQAALDEVTNLGFQKTAEGGR